MVEPPRAAAVLLEILYPEPVHSAVAGDLYEEFAERYRETGAGRARRWYWQQVARSGGPALMRRWRNGDALALLAVTGLAFATLWMATELGRFVLSQVPLKADESLSWPFEAVRWGLAAGIPALGIHWWRKERGRK